MDATGSFRFHVGRKYFPHQFQVAGALDNEQAAALLLIGDRKQDEKLVNGFTWLALDLASRCLDKYGLAEHVGEDLTQVGLQAIWKALPRLHPDDNIRAILSKAMEEKMLRYVQEDRLCRMPASTCRDRRRKGRGHFDRKGQPLPCAPTIYNAPHLDQGSLKGARCHSVIRTSIQPNCWQLIDDIDLPDVLSVCGDDCDKRIVLIRYNDGDGFYRPIPYTSVAKTLSIKPAEVKRRLDSIEKRLCRKYDRQSLRRMKRRQAQNSR